MASRRLNIYSSEGGNTEDSFTPPEANMMFSGRGSQQQPPTFMNTKKIAYNSYEITSPATEEDGGNERQSTHMEGEMPMRMTLEKGFNQRGMDAGVHMVRDASQ